MNLLIKLTILLSTLFFVASQSNINAAVTPGTSPGCPDTAIETALGCLELWGGSSLISARIIRLGVGLGGGIAFLLIIYAGFTITTSTGDPTRLRHGQELLTSAIGGIILLVFSVFILRLIGVDILGIF